MTVDYLKRQAKSFKVKEGITHTQALEKLAKMHGFNNWKECLVTLNSQSKNKNV